METQVTNPKKKSHTAEKMPLFSRRSSFRTPKKPPRRNSDSVPNISALDGSFNFTSDSLTTSLAPGAAPAVAMKLGDHEIFFENGEWVSSKSSNITSSTVFNSRPPD